MKKNEQMSVSRRYNKYSQFLGAVGFGALSFIAVSCGGNNTEAKKEMVSDTPAGKPAVQAETVAARDGKKLIEASDCRTCHKDSVKLIGPAFIDVAKKYTAANTDSLVHKVINGGMGVWGQIPMAPHQTLAKEDVEAMVKYILSFK